VAATVLIVDDHAGFRSFARALLEAEGFDVVGEAVDGASALGLTRTLAPELVLLGVALPDMDGFAVCEALLEDGPAPAVIMATTSLASPGTVSFYCRADKRTCVGCAYLRHQGRRPALTAARGRTWGAIR
jgi:CheY-like chemotaxis protein